MYPTDRLVIFLKTNFEIKTEDEANASSFLRLATTVVKRDTSIKRQFKGYFWKKSP